jgi:protein-histidine N-methyltransferase
MVTGNPGAGSTAEGVRGVESLMRWLRERGARMPALAIHHGADGQRSACARSRIAAGSLILEVPRRLFLSQELARDSDIGRRIAASGVELRDERSWLAALLLEERQAPGSPWAPYLATLPDAHRHMPLLFGPAQLALLEGSSALPLLEAQRQSILQDYQGLCRYVPGFERFSYAEFTWARLTVLTRTFRLTVQGQSTRAIVPLADLFDHHRPMEASWTFDSERDSFTLTALQDFLPGDLIRISYGRKSNCELLVHYGFCLEENEDDTAEVQVGGDSFHIPARHEAEATRRLFSRLRLASAQPGELPGPVPPLGEVAPVSARNEEAVLRALASACEQALGQFETTLEQDEALLREPGLGQYERNCIQVRRGEKQVLEAWRSHAETALALLRGASRAVPPAAGGQTGAGRFSSRLAPPPPSPTAGRAGAARVVDGAGYLQGVIWELLQPAMDTSVGVGQSGPRTRGSGGEHER